jgi:hypothetical protein
VVSARREQSSGHNSQRAVLGSGNSQPAAKTVAPFNYKFIHNPSFVYFSVSKRCKLKIKFIYQEYKSVIEKYLFID